MKKLGSDGAVVRSTLVIKDVAEEDFGAYGCKVANVFGSTSAVILLRKQSESNHPSNKVCFRIHVCASCRSFLSGDLLSSTPFRV